jgi:hypothetical protein
MQHLCSRANHYRAALLYTLLILLTHNHTHVLNDCRAVVESTQQQRNEEDELRVLRDMLWEEELEAKLIQQDREKQAKIEHDKVNMQSIFRSIRTPH